MRTLVLALIPKARTVSDTLVVLHTEAAVQGRRKNDTKFDLSSSRGTPHTHVRHTTPGTPRPRTPPPCVGS